MSSRASSAAATTTATAVVHGRLRVRVDVRSQVPDRALTVHGGRLLGVSDAEREVLDREVLDSAGTMSSCLGESMDGPRGVSLASRGHRRAGLVVRASIGNGAALAGCSMEEN